MLRTDVRTNCPVCRSRVFRKWRNLAASHAMIVVPPFEAKTEQLADETARGAYIAVAVVLSA